MSEYTWKQGFKDIPKTFKQGCKNGYTYWSKAPLWAWIAETSWLIILVAMFYYGIYGIVGYYEGTDVDPNSATGWFISFLPIYFVFSIFIVHWLYGMLVKFILNLMGIEIKKWT